MEVAAQHEELHERRLYRRFASLEAAARLPDDSTILRFRHLLKKHDLAGSSSSNPVMRRYAFGGEGQEHGTADYVVCTGQAVDGSPKYIGARG